jgi:hypothetical protein
MSTIGQEILDHTHVDIALYHKERKKNRRLLFVVIPVLCFITLTLLVYVFIQKTRADFSASMQEAKLIMYEQALEECQQKKK